MLQSETPTGKPLAIGDPYGGGILAYILQRGDPGYVPGETHGLIAAAADQSAGIIWVVHAHRWNFVPGATRTAIGSGAANTDAIIAQNGAGTTYAAGLARAYNGGGHSDWYLPSKHELNKLFLNRVAIGGFHTTRGDQPWYWSSSEDESIADYAWIQYFVNGDQSCSASFKDPTNRVRAVRAF